jgi:hypothetical protein
MNISVFQRVSRQAPKGGQGKWNRPKAQPAFKGQRPPATRWGAAVGGLLLQIDVPDKKDEGP